MSEPKSTKKQLNSLLKHIKGDYEAEDKDYRSQSP